MSKKVFLIFFYFGFTNPCDYVWVSEAELKKFQFFLKSLIRDWSSIWAILFSFDALGEDVDFDHTYSNEQPMGRFCIFFSGSVAFDRAL